MSLPIFSYDFLRDLFEHTASQDQSTALSLSLTSQDVNQWVTPFLYYSPHLHLREIEPLGPAYELLKTLTVWNPTLLSLIRRLQVTGDIREDGYVGRLLSTLSQTTTLISLSFVPSLHNVIYLKAPLPTTLTALTWEGWGIENQVQNFAGLQNLQSLHIIVSDNSRSSGAAYFLPGILTEVDLPQLHRIAFSFPPFKPYGRGKIPSSTIKVESLFSRWPSLPELLTKKPSINICVVAFFARAGFDGVYDMPQAWLDMIHGKLHQKIVVVGDEGLRNVDPDMLILSRGFIPSDWRDTSCWEAAEEHLGSKIF
ncbi:hypothetical protein DL96DRAFT_1723166 [Flagelloscypha sp. PMI_526]|nr:hypothetical protein DL96DRAFT_1723166 [Flagelloscypha sp. PMI_526]